MLRRYEDHKHDRADQNTLIFEADRTFGERISPWTGDRCVDGRPLLSIFKGAMAIAKH